MRQHKYRLELRCLFCTNDLALNSTIQLISHLRVCSIEISSVSTWNAIFDFVYTSIRYVNGIVSTVLCYQNTFNWNAIAYPYRTPSIAVFPYVYNIFNYINIPSTNRITKFRPNYSDNCSNSLQISWLSHWIASYRSTSGNERLICLSSNSSQVYNFICFILIVLWLAVYFFVSPSYTMLTFSAGEIHTFIDIFGWPSDKHALLLREMCKFFRKYSLKTCVLPLISVMTIVSLHYLACVNGLDCLDYHMV